MMIELIPAPFATHFSCTHSPVCFVSLLLIQPTLLFSFVAAPVCVYRHYATVYDTAIWQRTNSAQMHGDSLSLIFLLGLTDKTFDIQPEI